MKANPTSVDSIIQLFHDHGDSEYGGEGVNQREHALQSALLAEQADATPQLISAALLHDVGHLIHDLPDDAPDQGIDDRHETSGYHFLKRLFPEAVTEPVRLHVPAKRYLCAVDRRYAAQLSEPSVVSLRLQGGPMSAEEVAEFESHAFFRDAVRLRRWDDEAKIPDLDTPSVEYYRRYLEQSVGE